jgi:hypothetical protein
MAAARCPTVMAGPTPANVIADLTPATVVAGHVRHVPAIRCESLSRPVAGTCPAMTAKRTSVIADFVADA